MMNNKSDPSNANKYSELLAGTRPEIDARLIRAIMTAPPDNISQHASKNPAGGLESTRDAKPQIRSINPERALGHRAARG